MPRNPNQPHLIAEETPQSYSASDPLAHLHRPLTKADLDKVRDIEGFPSGTDEDIIALSDPPYYTACPNPFIEDFIRAYGKLYNEAIDTYHREPFAADVSEGKNDPVYLAQNYHTKVPYKAIMHYILHYTEPGDIVLDGFCGTGMTGVAAGMCGDKGIIRSLGYRVQDDSSILESSSQVISRMGKRYSVLQDLSPAATFLAYNYNVSVDAAAYEKESKQILADVQNECGWMYLTLHKPGLDQIENAISLIQQTLPTDIYKTSLPWAVVNYAIWSDVFICPECSGEIIFWESAVDKESLQVKDEFSCPSCQARVMKRLLDRAEETIYDSELQLQTRRAKQVPVLLHYLVGKKRFLKTPDAFDLALLQQVQDTPLRYWVPTALLPDGDKISDPKSVGVTNVHQFYTRRNLISLTSYAGRLASPRDYIDVASVATVITRMYRFRSQNQSLGAGGGQLAGTLYIPSLTKEIPVLKALREHIKKSAKLRKLIRSLSTSAIISTGSHTRMRQIPDQSIDYIFTDPPFGSNLQYSELNFLWEAWLQVFTSNHSEAVVNKSQHKTLDRYQEIMTRCFEEAYRVLKPGRWITIEFHNSQNRVWNAIQEAVQRAGFIVADVRTFDKKQGSYNQYNATGAVKQDLIISAYRPRASFEHRFLQEAGTDLGAWDFVRQHLTQLPIFVSKNDSVEIVAERQNYLLFDRMVAFHIQRGASVPLGASEFYSGLKQRFPERDGMFFLPEQVAHYDAQRAEVAQVEQLSLIVTDEKSAVQWLRIHLEQERQTRQEIHPKFTSELYKARHEDLPKLDQLLSQNFLQDAQGRWYVPDPAKSEDLEKLREKDLLREFGVYQSSKGKLKTFRTEAVRAGFKDAWAKRAYSVIIEIARRLPEDVLQEDPMLLMYYDNAMIRSE